MNIAIKLLILFIINISFAQTNDDNAEENILEQEPPAEEKVRIPPSFLNHKDIFEYIAQSIDTDNISKKNTHPLMVYVQFIIDENGQIKEISNKEKGDESLFEEIKRILLQTKWKAGTLGGEPTPMYVVLPIIIKNDNQ